MDIRRELERAELKLSAERTLETIVKNMLNIIEEQQKFPEAL